MRAPYDFCSRPWREEKGTVLALEAAEWRIGHVETKTKLQAFNRWRRIPPWWFPCSFQSESQRIRSALIRCSSCAFFLPIHPNPTRPCDGIWRPLLSYQNRSFPFPFLFCSRVFFLKIIFWLYLVVFKFRIWDRLSILLSWNPTFFFLIFYIYFRRFEIGNISCWINHYDSKP